MSVEVDAILACGIDPQELGVALDEGSPWLPVDAFEPDARATAAKEFLKATIRTGGLRVAVAEPEEGCPDYPEIHRVVDQHMMKLEVDQLTVIEKASQVAQYFLRAIRDREMRFATTHRNPLRGRPAFVVAAGPSLDLTGPLLAQAQELGPVIATNTSLKACQAFSVEPDYLVSVESRDLTGADAESTARSHFDGVASSTQCVLDIVAHPHNWEACADRWCISTSEPYLLPYLLDMGVEPTVYLGSVACAAAALAIQWGANPVVLVGQDLGYPGGRVYGQHTPFGDITAEVEERNGVQLIHFKGESKRMNSTWGTMAPAWGGEGECLSTYNFVQFAHWFEVASRTHCIINTEGGVRIDGSIELPLARVLNSLTRTGVPLIEPPPMADAGRVRERLLAEAKRYHGQRCTGVPAPLLGLFVTPAALIARKEGLTGQDFLDAITAAVDTGCEVIKETLDG